MNSILPAPSFDDNTFFHELVPSRIALESQWIIDNVNPNKLLGIVSMGHEGVELAKLDSDIHVFMPTETPAKIYDKTKKVANNVSRVGRNYPECYDIAEGIIRNFENMLNVSTGMVKKHLAHKLILEKPIREFDPDYIFIPDSNLDLCVGILEGLKESGREDITVVACILPDHYSISPRFNKTYRHKPFFASMSFMGHESPGLNRDYRLFKNVAIKTVVSPDYCYTKYASHYPNLDAMNFLPMELSTKFNTESRKLVITTGESLL